MASDGTPEVDPFLADAPSRRRRRWLSLLARVAVSVVALGWFFSRLEWESLVATLRSARVDLCVAAFLVYCTSQIISSMRWQLLARSVGLNGPLKRYVALYFVGMYFNLFLPTSMGGDVVRAWLLAHGPGQRIKAGLSVFSERFAGLMALLLLASIAAFPNWGTLPDWALWTVYAATAGALVGTITLPFLGKWSRKARVLAEALSLYRGQQKRWLGALGLSFVVQGLSVVMLALIGEALRLPVPWKAYAVVMPLVSLLTMLPLSINGVGIREWCLWLLLAPAGVTHENAAALGILWFIVLGAASALGCGVYVLGGFRREGKDANGPQRGHSDQRRAGQSAAAA